MPVRKRQEVQEVPRREHVVGGPTLARAAAAVGSGVALACAFPPVAVSGLAWFALVPLLLAARGRPPREASGWALLAGLAFWLPSLRWISCVTTAGWLTLAAYCALYMIPPVLLWARWPVRFGEEHGARILRVAAFAAAWTAAEYLRGVLLTGFPWNPLGVSQARSVGLIQHAAWGGAGAVSALVALANAALASELDGLIRRRRAGRVELTLALGLLIAALISGQRMQNAGLRRESGAGRNLRIAMIQTAVPQFEKWTPEFIEDMYGKIGRLTDAALRSGPLDLLVWPETAVPDDLRMSADAFDLLSSIDWRGVPALVGALDSEFGAAARPAYYNTAYLIEDGRRIVQTYDKQHLVLFGEYVPFGDALPFLRRLTPVEQTVEAGRRPVVFRLPGDQARFSVLICFEDVIPRLSRDFARRGAELLVNMTNDAWFDGSAGARQHLWNSVFRCVETRLPMARCANSGITGWVDSTGRVREELPATGPDGAPVPGFLRATLPLAGPDPAATFYLRHGDVWSWLCLAASALAALAMRNPKPPPAKSP